MKKSLSKNKKSNESKVPTLSDFNIEEARKSLIDMTKIGLQMTEFIYESETPHYGPEGHFKKWFFPPRFFCLKLIKNNIPACVYEFQADFSL